MNINWFPRRHSQPRCEVLDELSHNMAVRMIKQIRHLKRVRQKFPPSVVIALYFTDSGQLETSINTESVESSSLVFRCTWEAKASSGAVIPDKDTWASIAINMTEPTPLRAIKSLIRRWVDCGNYAGMYDNLSIRELNDVVTYFRVIESPRPCPEKLLKAVSAAFKANMQARAHGYTRKTVTCAKNKLH